MHAAFRTSSYSNQPRFVSSSDLLPDNVLEKPAESRPAYSVFKLDEIESKIVRTVILPPNSGTDLHDYLWQAKATDEIADLKAKAAARQAAREADERADISMEGLSNTSAEVVV